jgi:hypothetical protein
LLTIDAMSVRFTSPMEVRFSTTPTKSLPSMAVTVTGATAATTAAAMAADRVPPSGVPPSAGPAAATCPPSASAVPPLIPISARVGDPRVPEPVGGEQAGAVPGAPHGSVTKLESAGGGGDTGPAVWSGDGS